MFGYLAADPARLSPEELARYKACYCGLCRCLQERHGTLSRLTLNYDMTFLVLLLLILAIATFGIYGAGYDPAAFLYTKF